MKTRAAVAWKAGAPLTIEEVDLEGPRDGEVLVEVKATGICHTDYYTLSGADPEGLFPAILGHEGAGVVMEVGAGVPWLKPGDHVIPLYTPECRQCKFCLSRKTNLCQAIRSTQGKGLMPDGSSRFSIDGQPTVAGPVVKATLPPRDKPYEIKVKLRGEERTRFATIREGKRTRVRIAPPWNR